MQPSCSRGSMCYYNNLSGSAPSTPVKSATLRERDVYTLCEKGKVGKMLTVVAYNTEYEKNAEKKEIRRDFGSEKAGAKYEIYLFVNGKYYDDNLMFVLQNKRQ